MGILKVALLGNVRLTHNDWITEAKLPREIQALLAYLLVYRQRLHSREVLADVFWGEYSHKKARRALNTAIWRLKKAVEPEGIPAGTYLFSPRLTELGFNPQSQYWLDIEVFEQETNNILKQDVRTLKEPNVRKLETLLNIYQGELLEGFYDEWALRERERIRTLYLKDLIFLLQYYKFHRVFERAIGYGQRILDLDPLREDIHREMMTLYLASGQRALAARQYAKCQLTLAKELGISPMEETQLLYTQIFPESQEQHSSSAFEDQPGIVHVLGQLRQMSQTLDLAREQVQQAIYCITKSSSKTGDDKIPILTSRKRKATRQCAQNVERRIE